MTTPIPTAIRRSARGSPLRHATSARSPYVVVLFTVWPDGKL